MRNKKRARPLKTENCKAFHSSWICGECVCVCVLSAWASPLGNPSNQHEINWFCIHSGELAIVQVYREMANNSPTVYQCSFSIDIGIQTNVVIHIMSWKHEIIAISCIASAELWVSVGGFMNQSTFLGLWRCISDVTLHVEHASHTIQWFRSRGKSCWLRHWNVRWASRGSQTTSYWILYFHFASLPMRVDSNTFNRSFAEWKRHKQWSLPNDVISIELSATTMLMYCFRNKGRVC